MLPQVCINRTKLRENSLLVRALCARHGIELTGVTKVFRGDPRIAQVYLEAGLTRLGDSRVSNLQRMRDLDAEKWLIRPPMPSEAEALVACADVSLNSELFTIQSLAKAAAAQGKRHGIILMADLGDLREGYVDYEELKVVAAQVEKLQGVHLHGIGVNLTCFSFIQSDAEKMLLLAELAQQLSRQLGHPLSIVSGGNSATLDLMLRGGICAGVNHLRLGESLLFGKERACYQQLPGTHNDVFTLDCEIVELKEKPSLPWGRVGVDSYGNQPIFMDRGRRLKAVCAIGKQDFDPETTTPLDAGVTILGASSDHLMLDVTDSVQRYQVGDVVSFRLGYFSTMRAFTSSDVGRVYLDAER